MTEFRGQRSEVRGLKEGEKEKIEVERVRECEGVKVRKRKFSVLRCQDGWNGVFD